jgi:hypothetical protein
MKPKNLGIPIGEAFDYLLGGFSHIDLFGKKGNRVVTHRVSIRAFGLKPVRNKLVVVPDFPYIVSLKKRAEKKRFSNLKIQIFKT